MSAVLGSAEEAAEEGIHYMLLDVCLICLTWQSLFPALHKGSPSLSPQVKLAADALMDYLVSRTTGPLSLYIHNTLPLLLFLISTVHYKVQIPCMPEAH